MKAERLELGDESTDADEALDSLLHKVARIEDDAPPPLPKPGQIISGKYRIEERLGRGGMGVVFRATQLISQKPVALKWMLCSITDEYAHGRFMREALAAGRIKHTNVVDVYDICSEGHSAYLVMELLHGETLRDRIERGLAPVSEMIGLLLPALRGVAAAHRAGVIHRDLKPDNIFLCQGPDAAARAAKVLDFGISAVLASVDAGQKLTHTGAMLGTPAYMSPEQLDHASNIDARSDIYSCGVILYEALTGERPFASDSLPELVLAIVQKQPQSLHVLRPSVPVELAQVVLRALEKKPEDRFASTEQLIAALEPFASGQRPVQTPAVSSQQATAVPLIAAALCGLGLVSWAWAHWHSSAEPRVPAPGPMAETTQNPALQELIAEPAFRVLAEPPQATAASEPRPDDTLRANAAVSGTGVEPRASDTRHVTAAVSGDVPRSCEHARSAGRGSDGELQIDPDGPGPVQPFMVQCVGMSAGASSAPAREYLPLPAGSAANTTRFIYRDGPCACPDLERRFTHVRLDPRSLAIDPKDGTFASYNRPLECEAQHRSQCGESVNLSWASAGSCRAAGDMSGSGSIDLAQTPFALAASVRFVPAGFSASGTASFSADRKRAELQGGGLCGSVVPESANIALVQVR